MHVDWGSTINLTCVSKFSPVPPLDVIWYQNNKVILMLSYNSANLVIFILQKNYHLKT